MFDLLIYETGNGGDCRLNGNDLEVVEGYENMPYLAMFGGADWWGNYLLDGNAAQQFDAQTEQTMQQQPLSSAGRIAIEGAMLADLAFFKQNLPGTAVSVSTSVATPDRLDAHINIDGEQVYLQWNPSAVFLNYRV